MMSLQTPQAIANGESGCYSNRCVLSINYTLHQLHVDNRGRLNLRYNVHSELMVSTELHEEAKGPQVVSLIIVHCSLVHNVLLQECAWQIATKPMWVWQSS